MSVGAPAIAGWIAQVVFLALLIVGWGELGPRRVVLFLALWLAGFAARSYVLSGPALFTPYVAILDIVLVLSIFKGDTRIG